MQLNSWEHHTSNLPQNSPEITPPLGDSGKPPHSILTGIFAFAPNRDTLGGTAYFIVNKGGNILVDCPVWHQNNQAFLAANGGVRWLVISHRGGIGKKIGQIQAACDCEVIIQEQEVYLLPELTVTSFSQTLVLTPGIELIWTPGHSPGSSCLYWQEQGGVLFCGRHLLPNTSGKIQPLRTAKTFHWLRQLRSVQKLRDRFTPETLSYVCPGANTGFLRGQGYIGQAYQKLTELDLAALQHIETYV